MCARHAFTIILLSVRGDGRRQRLSPRLIQWGSGCHTSAALFLSRLFSNSWPSYMIGDNGCESLSQVYAWFVMEAMRKREKGVGLHAQACSLFCVVYHSTGWNSAKEKSRVAATILLFFCSFPLQAAVRIYKLPSPSCLSWD